MHQLLLLRHAKAALAEAGGPDRERPLNAFGRRAATTLRRTMRELGLVPDLVLVSTARRTLETLEALEPWDDTPLIEPMDELYLASAARLLDALRGVAETVRGVLLIGHNPGLHDLAMELAGPGLAAPPLAAAPLVVELRAGFPTAALAEYAIAGPWSRLAGGNAWGNAGGSGRLVRLLTPRGLKEPD